MTVCLQHKGGGDVELGNSPASSNMVAADLVPLRLDLVPLSQSWHPHPDLAGVEYLARRQWEEGVDVSMLRDGQREADRCGRRWKEVVVGRGQCDAELGKPGGDRRTAGRAVRRRYGGCESKECS
uniref:Uncharacterized protein n=1 Tax=Oryza rufipogon TaxID=4529 RepID=A0A0E0P7T5_ORYRU